METKDWNYDTRNALKVVSYYILRATEDSASNPEVWGDILKIYKQQYRDYTCKLLLEQKLTNSQASQAQKRSEGCNGISKIALELQESLQDILTVVSTRISQE